LKKVLKYVPGVYNTKNLSGFMNCATIKIEVDLNNKSVISKLIYVGEEETSGKWNYIDKDKDDKENVDSPISGNEELMKDITGGGILKCEGYKILNSPLTKSGISQSTNAADSILSDMGGPNRCPMDKLIVITSPLFRCIQTTLNTLSIIYKDRSELEEFNEKLLNIGKQIACEKFKNSDLVKCASHMVGNCKEGDVRSIDYRIKMLDYAKTEYGSGSEKYAKFKKALEVQRKYEKDHTPLKNQGGGGGDHYSIFSSTGLKHDSNKDIVMKKNPLKDPTALKTDAKRVYQNHANKICRAQSEKIGFLCQDGINDKIREGLQYYLEAVLAITTDTKINSPIKKPKFVWSEKAGRFIENSNLAITTDTKINSPIKTKKLVIYFERHGAALHNKVKMEEEEQVVVNPVATVQIKQPPVATTSQVAAPLVNPQRTPGQEQKEEEVKKN